MPNSNPVLAAARAAPSSKAPPQAKLQVWQTGNLIKMANQLNYCLVPKEYREPVLNLLPKVRIASTYEVCCLVPLQRRPPLV
jgi:hypothetical protein